MRSLVRDILITLLCVGLPFAWYVAPLYAGDEVYPAGVTTTTIVGHGRYTTPSVVAGGRDTTQMAVNGSSNARHGLLYFDLSTIPANRAIIAAHVRIVAHKDMTANYGTKFFRIMAPWDSTAVTHVKRTGAANWSSAGTSLYVFNWDQSSALGDTTTNSTSADRLSDPEEYCGVLTTIANTEYRVQVTDAVRRWYTGAWANYGFLVVGEDTTSAGTLSTPVWKWTANTTAAYRPRLDVVHVAVGGDTTTVAGITIGRDVRGVAQ